ncbi:fibronectin type III domain protein [Trichuris suis]|nr:fibronectin type III domain protein [Trichuris suis]
MLDYCFKCFAFQSVKKFALFKECEPVYPTNLSGTCVKSALSPREICYPDFYQLDYTCAARYGVNQRSVSPPTIANGQYKSLITKFRAGDGRPSQLKAYLVVQYQCNAGFEFVDEVEHLYCQKGKWIATPPMCIPSHLIEEYRTPGNPCLIDHAGCSHYCRFISPASARCECSDGYLLNSDGKTCVELKNPCDLDNGGCSHFCVDEGQGRAHRCRCPPDHTLASDGRTCEPAKRRTGDSAGFCKDLSYGYPDNSCKDECHMDEDCPVGSRCCWNGCSQVCFQPVDGDLPTCDDAMGCECSVLNVTHHQCRCSKKLCLMPTVAPVVSISPGRRLQLQPESSINVTCIAEGFPTPAIMWYWDSFPITDSKDVISPEPSKLVLQLKNISTSITLRCEAVNNLGMASSQLEIMVIGPGSPPKNVTTRVDGFKATITWQEPEFSNGPIEKYELNYVDTEAVGEKPSRKWVILETSEPKADLTLLPSTTYYVKIRAFNKFGPGPFTPIFYVVTESEGNNEAKDNACCALTQRLQEFPPKVKIRPDNQVHVPRGGRVELECAAVGNPAPTVAWYKDGKLLEEPDDSNPTITLLQLEDVIQSTTYECQAENKLGKTNVSVSIIVLGPGSPPQKIQYHLVDGVNVEIEWEPPTISNGEILGYTIHYTDSPSEDIGNWEFLFSGVSPSIEVLDLKPHTSYTFGIRALNAFGPGPLSARFVVNTTQPSAEPKVAVFPSELVMLPPGGSMNVSCSSTGYPVPLLRWLEKENEVKSFAELPAGEGVEASRVLVIEQIYETTTFTCEAENSEGVDSRDVHVRITGIMTAESFSIKQFHSGPGNAPKNVKVEAVGADVTIRWQPPTITNGEIKDYVVYIAEDPEQLEEKWIEYHTDCPNTEMKLTLEPNKLYAARIAACTEYGCGVKSEPFEVRTLHVGSSPIVVIEPDEEVRQVKPGSSHHITCTASAYPPPLLTWYKNNVKIKSWQMPPVGGGQPEPLSFVLTIGHVAETLLLECEAVNEIGTAKRSITLEVLGPGSPPENISYVVVGDSVEIRWDEPVHKNGPIEMYNLSYIANDDLPNGTWTSVSISGDDEKFVLLNLEEDTAYQIKLAAVGPGGSGPFSEPLLLRTSRAEVKPSVSIDPPTLKYQLHWGERLKVLCSASGNPQPLATWYLLGERVSDIGPEVTLDEEIYESSEYECTALNKLGTASTKISVTVKDDHQLPADVTAEVKGTSVELKWEKPESDSVVSFIIYYSNHSDGHENVFHLVVPVEDPKRVRYSVVLDNLRPASNYSIRLQAVFDMGPGPMSEDMKITTGDKAWYIGCNVEPKSPLDVPYGAGISVRCIGKGEPTPHIVVRRNGNKVEGPIKNPFELRLDDIHEPVFIECLAQNEVGRAKDSLSLFPTNELTSQTRPTLEITEDGVQISWPHLSSLAVPGMTYEAYISEDEDAPLDSWSKLPVNPEAWSALLDNLPTGRRLFARLKMYPFAKNSVLWTPKSELTLPQPLKDVSLKLVNGRFKLHIGDFVFPDDMVINVAITDNVSKPLDQWLSFPLTKDPNDGSAVSSIDVESGRKYYLRVVAIKGGNRKLLSLIHNITTPALDLCQQSQCEHTCKVVRGSHSSPENVVCQCFSGYELASDGRSCVPIMSASTWLHKNKSHRRFCSVPTTNSYCPGTGIVWYYNPATSRCVTLNQSGCEGSVYEFQSWLDCMDACSSQRCHRLRRQHFIRKTSKAFLPECDDNGDFDPLQCHQSAGQCWCVDVKTGQEIPGTKRNIVDGTPECKGCNYQLSQVLSSYQHKLTTVQFLPKCTADGLYERVQCADDSDDCWCVDEVSGEEIDGTRSTIRPLSCELKAKVKPENVQVKIQNSSLYLKWEMPNNVSAKKYYVYFTQKPEEPINKWYVVVVYSPQDKKEIKLMNVALPEAKYAIKVKPVLDNESGVASEVTFAEPTGGQLSKPVNFRVDKVTPDSATLAWDRPDDWEGRNVKVSFHVTNLNTGEEMETKPMNDEKRQFLALEPGTSYLVSMVVLGNNGQSSFSEPIAVRTDEVAIAPIHSTTSSPRSEVVVELSTLPSVQIPDMPEIIEYSEPQDYHLLWRTTAQPVISSSRLLKPEDATVGSQKKESHSLIPTYDVGDGKISSAKDGMTLSMPEVAGKQYPLPGHTDKQLLPAGRIPDSEPQPGRRYPLPGHSVDQLLPPGRVPEVERQPERAYPLPGHSNEQLLPTGRIPEAERQPERRYPLPGHSNEQLLPAGRIPDTDRQPERRYPSPGHSIDQLLPPGRISEVERQSGSAYPFPGHSNEQLLPAGRIPDADQQPEGGYPLPGHSIDQLLPPGRISEVERQSGSAYPLPGHSNEQLLPAGQIPNAERQPKRPHPLPGHSNEQMLPTGRKPNAERQSERQLPLPGHSSEQLLPAGRTSVSERPPERQFPLPGYSNEQLLAPGRIPEAERHSGRQFPLPDLSSNQFVPAGRITNAERQHPMARHSNELSLPADRIPDATVGVPGSRYEVYTRSPITEKVYVPPIVEERPFFPSLKTSDLDTPVEYTTSTTDPLYRSTISSRDRKDGEIGHRDPPGPVQFRLSKKPGRTGFYVFWKQQKGANVPKEYILYVAEGRHSSLPATATKTVVPASVHGYSVDATRPIRYTVWMQARNRFGVGPLSKPKLWFPSKPVSTHSPVPNWAPILVSADPIAPEAVALKWIVPRGRTMPDADLTAIYSDNPKTPMDQWPSQVIPKGAKDHGLLRVPHTARPYKICLQFDAPLGKGRPSNCLTTKPFQGTYGTNNNDVFPIVASMPIISTKEKGVSAKDRAALIRGSINKGEKRKKWVPRLLSAEPLSSDRVVVRWQPPSNHEAIDSDILIHYGNDEGRRIDTWPYVMARSKESGQEIVKVLPSDQPYTFCARLRDSDGVGQTSNCIRARLEPTTSVTSTTVTTPIRPDDRRAYMKSLSPPMAPTITSVSKTGPSSLTVTWDTPNDRSLEDNDIMIYYTDDPSKPIAYWQSIASAEERRSKTFKISNKDKTYTVCARSRNQYGLGELSNCVTSEGLPGAVANQSSRQSISGQQISNENGQPLGTSVDARSSKSNPSDYGESLPRSQATIYTYNPWLYTAAPGRLYNVNSDRMTPVAARKAKEKGSREIPVKDSTWPSEKLPRILSSKSTLSNKEIGKQPLPPSLYDEDEPYSPVIKSSVGHRPRDIVDREDNERYVKTEGEPYSSRGISEQRPGDRIDEEVERERMDRNEPYLPIGTVEEQPSNAIHGQVKPYAEDRRQPFASKHFKKSKRPIDNMVREKADDNRRKPAKSKPRSSVARGNVERQRPHGKAERYTIDKSQPSSATSKTAGSEPYANIQAAGNEPMRRPLGYQPEEDGMSDYKTESYTTTSPSTNCDFAQFTKSIPDDSVTTASACNCTCGAPTAYSKKIVCFYEDALEVRDNLPFGRLSQFTQSAVQVTPVPPGAEQSCNCLRPQQGEQCPDGYLMKSNGICYDIDECAYRNGGCSQGCVNTAGSFYCACPYGMVRDPENPFQCATTDSFLAKLSKLFTVYVWDKIRGNALSLESLIGTKENDAAKT